jgi:hypothetical protein
MRLNTATSRLNRWLAGSVFFNVYKPAHSVRCNVKDLISTATVTRYELPNLHTKPMLNKGLTNVGQSPNRQMISLTFLLVKKSVAVLIPMANVTRTAVVALFPTRNASPFAQLARSKATLLTR